MKRRETNFTTIDRFILYILFAFLLLMTNNQYAASQRHVIYKGVCLDGKVDKVKKKMEKMGWTNFRQYRGCENSISTTGELSPNYIVTSVELLYSTKSQTVSSLLFVLRDVKRDSIYNLLYYELDSTYYNCHNYIDGTKYFFVKNKKKKNIGIILLKKMKYGNDLVILVIDFRNHYKAIREGGLYLEEFCHCLDLIFR